MKSQNSSITQASFRIPPFHYIHVLNRNTNITRLEVGPKTIIRQDHEEIVTGDLPVRMVTLPPRNYCEINDPVINDKQGAPSYDEYGQVLIRHGDYEVRFYEKYPNPFPLYPGESIKTKPSPLLVVKENTALRLEATRNFEREGKKVIAGDEWLFEGPATYYPRVEERITAIVNSQIVKKHQALKLRARQDFTDRNGIARKTGDEWLVRTPGSYLPGIYENVVGLINPYIITDQTAVQFRAIRNFKDFYGVERKAGDEWLVIAENISTEEKNFAKSSYHIIDVSEEFVNLVPVTILRRNQYCYVSDPYNTKAGKNNFGGRELRVGELNFFLKPGESIPEGIKDAIVLQEDQGLLMRAQEKFTDLEGKERKPGEKWMIQGPTVYIPPVQVEIVEYRNRVALDTNEGVYVRDINTGQVRCEFGKSYMLKAHEEFWNKELTEIEETLLAKNLNFAGTSRDKKKVVTFRCPFANVIQIYDYKRKESRMVVGPAMVYLGPDEQFTVTVLSGCTPKKPGVIKKLSIDISPTFTSDIVTVETSDHTRLNLQLAYNWYFKLDMNSTQSISKVYEVADFIGNLCSQLGSRVRSAVAAVGFDEFHKQSARIIRKSVLGVDEKGKIRDEFLIGTNQIAVTNVDIKSVEPVDKITLDNIQKSVTQAIEISTKSLEAQYKYQSDMMQQQAMGQLEKIKIDFQAKAESAKKKLLAIRADSESIQSTGTATAEAKSRAESSRIESETRVKIAKMKANAKKIETQAELEKATALKTAQLEHDSSLADIDINFEQEMAKIEAKKFQDIISAIGSDTLVAISNAGPEFQAELLKSLGLSGSLLIDANNPINMFSMSTVKAGGDTNTWDLNY